MLTVKQQKHYANLLRVSAQRNLSDQMTAIELLEVARSKYYRELGRHSLVEFIIMDLKIDATVTFEIERVVRAAIDCPELEQALIKDEITVGKATRILGSLKPDNAKELVGYASTHTFAEINRFVAGLKPEKKRRESFKQLSANQFEVRLILTAQQFKDLQRGQSLEAQKGKPRKMSDVIGIALKDYLWRHDPVEKAARAKPRTTKIVRTVAKDREQTQATSPSPPESNKTSTGNDTTVFGGNKRVPSRRPKSMRSF